MTEATIISTSSRGNVGKTTGAKAMASFARKRPTVIHIEDMNVDSLATGIDALADVEVLDALSLQTLADKIDFTDGIIRIIDMGVSANPIAMEQRFEVEALFERANLVVIPAEATESGLIDAEAGIKFAMDNFNVPPELIFVYIAKAQLSRRDITKISYAANEWADRIREVAEGLGAYMAKSMIGEHQLIREVHASEQTVRSLSEMVYVQPRDTQKLPEFERREAVKNNIKLRFAQAANSQMVGVLREMGARVEELSNGEVKSPFVV